METLPTKKPLNGAFLRVKDSSLSSDEFPNNTSWSSVRVFAILYHYFPAYDCGVIALTFDNVPAAVVGEVIHLVGLA